MHDTTKLNGKYQKDPLGAHVTLCYKTEAHLRRGTHVASHGYVKSMADWTYKNATHDPEKLDDTKKRNGEEIWPVPDLLRELPPIEYSLPAEYMEDWARTAEAAAAVHYNQTLDFSLSTPASVGESSQAGGQQAQELPIVDIEMDTFAEVEAKESHYFRLKLLDGSTVRAEASRWQEAQAWYSEAWDPCYLYISQKSGARYWTWTLEPSKSSKADYSTSHKKGKGKK